MKYFLIISLCFLSFQHKAYCRYSDFVGYSEKTPVDTIKSLNDSVFVKSIIISGNKRTRNKIILREITLKEDIYYSAFHLHTLINESHENLINTSLFNFVNIQIATTDKKSKQVVILVDLKERWYTWVYPVLKFKERNFNTWWETMDFTKINYGLSFKQENIRGRREELKFDFNLGFDEEIIFEYVFPYINPKQTFGLVLGFGYRRNHEVYISTFQNKLQYYKKDDDYLRKDQFAALAVTLRKGIYNSHVFQIQFDRSQFADTLLLLNPNYTLHSSRDLPYLSFLYKFKNDYRDYKHYPLKGHYFDVEFINHGFGILDNHDLSMTYIISNYRKYWSLDKRVYLATGITGKISSNTFQPYFLQCGLGYDRDFVRGYEYYVIDGQHYILSKSNLKYEIIPTKVKTFSFIPINKFKTIHYAAYLNLFFDMAYVDDDIYSKGNYLNNTFLFGTGLGLDFVTYYDSIMRIEFALNRLKESGIFIHFMAPI